MKNIVLGAIILAAIVFLSGCGTAAGFAYDVKTAWKGINKADQWFRENYW